jgi:hypothetical protein
MSNINKHSLKDKNENQVIMMKAFKSKLDENISFHLLGQLIFLLKWIKMKNYKQCKFCSLKH